ncbi:class I SAM-dependent methyltransferase [Aldersonia sp. NBC_00410]|uniref:class I SAM-dependent methyltransferase n=1 Tax=Aldersonia sp. NBC_00410 TaxID=2975954 RepID=UPI00225589E9|nr:class I SAM-dependent methyltransferase [Aldersonia sp. NBC_00410]MCX5042594.1 class I SAM-dependent methyltransferase [Aldersonia sp. NBC_00410]
MSTDDPLSRAVALGVSVDALAALAAHIRIETEGIPADPAVRAVLADIATELLGAQNAPIEQSAPVVGLARTFVAQAADLIDDPGRSGGWDRIDPVLLQSIGRLSGAIVGAFTAAQQRIPDLREPLNSPRARFLDVGTGTGWLAIGAARAYPNLSVVGIDIFDAALELARANVAASGVSDRIELRRQDVTTLCDSDGFDAVWLPLPFRPESIVPAAVEAAIGALRPRGWVLAGTFAGPPGVLPELLTDLRTVRSGGRPWRGEDLLGVLRAAGLDATQEVPRSWPAPVRLYVGQRPAR